MKKKSVTLNFVMNFILTASSLIFPLITFPYVSRVLGPAGTGSVATATAVVSYFTMIAMLGIPTYGIRACARLRDDPAKLSACVQELLIINMVMCAIAYILFFITITLVPAYAASSTLYTVCSAAILLNAFGASWLYQALEEYTYITIASLLFKVLGLALMFLFVRSAADTVWYGAITVISSFGSNLINFLRLRSLHVLQPVKKYHFIRHLKPIGIFFAMSVATTVYTNLDIIMVQAMKGDEAAGYYNAAVKIKGLMVLCITSLGTVLLPRLSYYARSGHKKEFHALVVKAIDFVLLISIPCCLFFIVQARNLILFLSGSQFLGAVTAMQIITPTIALIGLSNITGIQILVPTDREKAVLYSVAGGALLDFVINLICIPRWSAAGAAFGTLMAEILVLAIQCCVLKDLLRRLLARIEWKVLLAAFLPSALVLFAVNSLVHTGVFLSLLLNGAAFFGLYFVLLLVCREEILTRLLSSLKGRFI